MKGRFPNFIQWIKDHQLISFFLLTFLITWGLGFSYWAVVRGGKFLLAPVFFLATCGPALAGIIISVLTGSRQNPAGRRITWSVFFIVWILALAVFILNFIFINKASVSPIIIVVVAVSALPVAFIVSMVYTRFPIVRGFLFLPAHDRSNLRWIVTALILLPALTLISIFVSQFLGRSSNSFANLPSAGITLFGWLIIKFLYQFFFFNGTGEEVGWRGFALPRLQVRVSPLIAGLVLALIWVPWHVFLWHAEGRPINTWSFWLMSYSVHIPAAVIICWLFNKSGGSILAAGIAHAAANTAMALFNNLDANILSLTFFVFVVVIVFTDRMWRKLPKDHPAVYRMN